MSRGTVISIVLTLVILTAITSEVSIPAQAVQLDVMIPKNSKEIVPTFQFTKVVMTVLARQHACKTRREYTADHDFP